MDRYVDEGPAEVSPPPAAPKPAPKPPAKPQAKAPPAKPATPPAKPAEQVTPEADTEQHAEGEADVKVPEGEGKPGEVKAPGRDNPWKLVEKFKTENRMLKRERDELRANRENGELPKQHQERVSAIEKRNQELEEEIRFVNYKKSKDYVENYQKPYEEAWANALSEIRELSIANEDGSSRVATAQDMLALAQMPLGQARATAKQWFGDAADDIMSHRRTIRELSDKQDKALETARKTGSEREAKMVEEQRARAKARAEETGKIWNDVNSQFVEKYDFLRPVEGETERNQLLEKATKFIDDTFSLNVNQARTEEERAQIVKQHAALRSRAIGFSVLKHENKALKAKVEELSKALSEFQGSEPTGGEPRDATHGEFQADTLDAAVANLAKLAS
jgi:hypothetical protein